MQGTETSCVPPAIGSEDPRSVAGSRSTSSGPLASCFSLSQPPGRARDKRSSSPFHCVVTGAEKSGLEQRPKLAVSNATILLHEAASCQGLPNMDNVPPKRSKLHAPGPPGDGIRN